MPKNLLRRVSTKKKKSISETEEKIIYEKYNMTVQEYIRYGVCGILIISIFGYFFYRSVFFTILMLPGIVIYLKKKKQSLCRQRKMLLNIQFKEMLNSVHASLQGGYSLENAFFEAYRDMAVFYGQESIISKELLSIKKGIRNNRTIEEMLVDLGNRSGVDDIRDFANILVIGKKSGGNIIEIMESSIVVIEEKVSVLQEIDTMISSRKFEQKFMSAIPFLIIFYIELTSRGFFIPLYESLFGRIIMSVCLIIYLYSIFLSNKIMNITV